MTHTQGRRRIAGTALLIGGIVYLVAEAVAARAWIHPTYSYADDHISDLGIPGLSPWSDVMNTGLLVEGSLFVFALIVVARGLHAVHAVIVVVSALAHGLGAIVVALVHASRHGTPFLHGVGAAGAIVGGAALLIAMGWVPAAPTWYRSTSVCLGIVGLIAFVFFVADVGRSGDGTLERVSAYTVIGWELLTGALLVARSRR